MTAEHLAFAEHGQAAERAGDAAAALEYHRGIVQFDGSPQRAVLAQLAGLSDEMTPWLWARWAAHQCTRAEDPGTRSKARVRAALEYTVTMFHERQLHDAYVEGGDPVRLTARVLGEDWAYRQVIVHELEGLETFLDELAGERLREEASLARRWMGARMGGYRLEPSPGLTVWAPAEEQRIELLDLGAGCAAPPGSWVIGRLVPSGTTPELMFDTRPLPVDERTAREVAAGSGRGEWVTPLKAAMDDGRLGPAALWSKTDSLAVDVTGRDLIEAGTPPRDLERVLRQQREGRNETARAAFRILRSAAEGALGDDDRAPYVAAAVLDPCAYRDARATVVHAGQREVWSRWAALVPEPARGRLRSFAEASGADAA